MMEHYAAVPLWAAVLVSFFLLLGSALTLIGAVGLLRMTSFYERIHMPTLGTSWGAGGIVVASMLFFSVLSTRPVLHEILIGLFVTVTTPVTLMLLGGAAVQRDRMEGNDLPALETGARPPVDEPAAAIVREP
ncbi:monovalent cation/H(+) antiporter subunit G [Rhizobium sp. TRM95111]|uniref:monovalent cation/H(+) antiporter subunit G n=1 Tax=Rhizobium alarense TaxID=2846851 RepID=UPI001F22696C|nr:monovalent cation/H(+) antiporter subunit G [Rhizobium alarense]MCF3641141.1 monovalent cation/H(+) antiporter subunit G [Rhizobium alarense]